jgi:hypothetical protein
VDWFGEPWPSGICEDGPGQQRPTPVGELCGWCSTPILEGERGVFLPHYDGKTLAVMPWHRECLMRSTVGSPAHMLGECTCCGGDAPAKTLTPAEQRAEALESWRMWAQYGRAR